MEGVCVGNSRGEGHSSKIILEQPEVLFLGSGHTSDSIRVCVNLAVSTF